MMRELKFFLMALIAIVGMFCAYVFWPRTEEVEVHDKAVTLVSAAEASARWEACRDKVRLDIVAPGSGFPVKLGAGATYSLPPFLLPDLDFGKSARPLHQESLSMTFWFPDMTPTGSVATINKIMDRQRGIVTKENDRFRVDVFWMWYSPPDADSFVPGSVQPEAFGYEPRPPRILLNRYCFNFEAGRCNNPTVRVSSGVAGTQVIRSKAWLKDHPQASVSRPGEEATYVEKPNAPYELVMDCDGAGGLTCKAHVYSKKHHLQYRMTLPAESVEHIEQLIGAIDKMLDAWLVQQNQ